MVGRDRAVVVGGSVAGLLAARVLADHFRQVTLVERDVYPERGPDVRRHLPQARHQHILLMRGREVLEQLFPGFDGEVAAHGGPLVDYPRDCLLVSAAGRLPRFPSALELRLCRRPVLDWVLRSRLLALPNLTFRTGWRAVGLLPGPGARQVAGLAIQPVAAPADPCALAADLVVDASGRASELPRWLRALGFEAPPVEDVDPFLGYASRLYLKPRDPRCDWKAIEIAARPPHNPRAAGLWEVEEGRWLLTLIGTAKAYPPVDPAGFLAFARDLPDPSVFEAIRHAEPLSAIHAHRGLGSRWRHYERLRRFPEGLVVLGDAFCGFNPTHGQGMTVAALSALILDRHLRGNAGPGPGVHQEIAELLGPVWRLATSDDLRWPGTVRGRTSLRMRLLLAFQDLALPLAPRSPRLVEAFLQVANLVRPARSLLRPGLLLHLARLRLS
jgi:2-polyprenyl-6-methoxyphenol hydroxylase-like FAD-dependent oxidoreductase